MSGTSAMNFLFDIKNVSENSIEDFKAKVGYAEDLRDGSQIYVANYDKNVHYGIVTLWLNRDSSNKVVKNLKVRILLHYDI
jgi:hypothetical protein